MIHTREAPLAERVLGVLEAFLRGRRDDKKDLCADLRPALLQALQRLNVEDMGHGAHGERRPRAEYTTFLASLEKRQISVQCTSVTKYSVTDSCVLARSALMKQ